MKGGRESIRETAFLALGLTLVYLLYERLFPGALRSDATLVLMAVSIWATLTLSNRSVLRAQARGLGRLLGRAGQAMSAPDAGVPDPSDLPPDRAPPRSGAGQNAGHAEGTAPSGVGPGPYGAVGGRKEDQQEVKYIQ